MKYEQRVVRGAVASHHFVQFFDTQESRAAAVASFLAVRAALGEQLLVVSKPEHWVSVRRQLESSGVDVAAAEADGRLVFRDALALLSEISHNGELHAPSFDAVVGAQVRRLSNGAPVSIYGGMVDVLAERGELDAAVALEALWNALAERQSLTLMCGYGSAHFVSASAELRLRQVCDAHRHVQTRPQDPLGRWLLNGARLAFRDDPTGSAA